MNRLKNLYHTTCRNRILEEKTTGKRVKLQMWTRKMERERYCELIWCSNVIWFLRWSLIQNHFPHKMHKRGIDWVLKCNMLFQLVVDSKSFSTQNAQEENWFICMLLQLIVYSKSYHFPHKMHRRRRMGSTCRSFTQKIAPKVWFWFPKLILKRSGSFLGKVYHHYKHFFYRFDRNVIKPSGRAWFRCSVRGCSAKWANYKKNITNKHTNLSGWPLRTRARRARITRSPSLIWRQFLR